MSYSQPAPQSAPKPPSRRGTYLAVGCAVIALCVLCAAAAGGGYYFYSQRNVPTTGSVPSVEYILDATSRMSQPAEGENDTRLNVARGVLAEIVRPSDPTVTAGLRVFGSGAQPTACNDTALLVPLAPSTQEQISTHLLAVTTGTDPAAAMSQAMVSAIRDLAAVKGKHTLVVVTGGADSCNPQAGELIASEAQKAGIDLKFFVIGFQVPSGDGSAIKGAVDSAGGTYVEASSKQQLHDVLNAIQVYVEDHSSTNTSSVVATLAAAVGTQTVASAGTPPPGSTSGPENTAAPAATSTPAPGGSTSPTAVATAAGTQGGTGTGGTGQTACDHPYWPMRTGSTWTFSSDTGSMTWTVTGVTGDQNDANATMEFKVADVTGTYHWHCTPAGIVSYDFGNLSTSAGGVAVNFNVTNQSGVFLIPADQLTQGAQWDAAYSLVSSAQGVTVSDDVAQHFTVAGTESVTAAGETHDALRINTTTTINIKAGGVTTAANGTATYYLVRGIGPVQFTSQFGSAQSTTTLQSYSIP